MNAITFLSSWNKIDDIDLIKLLAIIGREHYKLEIIIGLLYDIAKSLFDILHVGKFAIISKI